MDVLTETQHRALAFIQAANSGGYSPRPKEVSRWLREPTPRVTGGIADQISRQLANSISWSGIFGQSEGVISHLRYLNWVEGESDLRMTALGRALLASAESTESEGVEVVVLNRDDPLAYPTLIGQLADTDDAMLVDPYLEAAGALDLIRHTGITRALVLDAPGTAKKRAGLATLLATELGANFEVRAHAKVHDRYVIAGPERAWMIGASLNGVGRRATTVVTPLPTAAATAVALEMQVAWGEGSLVAPAGAQDDSSAAGDEGGHTGIG